MFIFKVSLTLGTRLTENQTQMLMKRFLVNEYLSKKEKRQFAKAFNTSKRRIEKWFNNVRLRRRAQGILPKSE